MRWAFGGRMFPEEGLKPGTYTGLIPVTVHDEEDKYKWEFTMPVAFTMAEVVPECRIITEEFVLPGIKFTDTPDGTPGSQPFPRKWDVQVLSTWDRPDDNNTDAGFPRINHVDVLSEGKIPGFNAEKKAGKKTLITLRYKIPSTGFSPGVLDDIKKRGSRWCRD